MKIKPVTVCICLLTITAVLLFIPHIFRPATPSVMGRTEKRNTFHFARQFDTEAYAEVFRTALPPAFSGQIMGGVAPHHLLAAPIIAEFYLGLRNHPPPVVIIIGPDHYNLSSQNITTSEAVWVTPFGNLSPDTDLITKLAVRGTAVVEEQPFETEHSVYNHVPFIRYMFPDARIVPLIVRSSATVPEIQNLSAALSAEAPAGTVMIASVDFSHKADAASAKRQDAHSIDWLKNNTADTIPGLHTDANAVLLALKLFSAKRGAAEFRLTAQSDASRFGTPDNPKDLTSYVSGYYTTPY